MNVYDFKVLNQKGEEVSLDIYKGKVLLIVNTATKCGFTPQYEAFEAMYEELHDKGFEILDFPCNQFMRLFVWVFLHLYIWRRLFGFRFYVL